jgi:hypothetical protein
MIRLPRLFKRSSRLLQGMLQRTYTVESLEKRILLSATLGADLLNQSGNYLLLDSVIQVNTDAGGVGLANNGAVDITTVAANGQNGSVSFGLMQPQSGGNLDGNANDGLNNVLNITTPAAASVNFYAAIGSTTPLDGLTINSGNVTFYQTVKIAGDLTINATGAVRFLAGVEISAGGDFSIIGAASVVFDPYASLTMSKPDGASPGNVLIEADAIALPQTSTSVYGDSGASITLRPTSVNRPINVASPSEGAVANSSLVLNLGDLSQIESDFTTMVIGRELAAERGDVFIGGDASTFSQATTIYGKNITVVDEAAAPGNYLATDFDLTLNASEKISIEGRVVVGSTLTPRTLTLVAGSEIEQSHSLLVPLEPIAVNNLITTSSTGTVLPWLDVNQGTVVNTGATGDVILGVVNKASKDFNVLGATQSHASNTGDVEITTTDSALVVKGTGAGVVAAENVVLSAKGALTVEAMVGSAAVRSTLVDVSLSSTGAAVVLQDEVTAGGALLVSAHTSVTALALTAGTADLLSVTSATGTITLNGVLTAHDVVVSAALGNVSLSQVVADGTAVSITSGGSIVSLLAAGELLIDANNAHLVLDAVNGVGTASVAIKTHVDSLAVRNTTSGNILVNEIDALTLSALGPGETDAVVSQGSGGAVLISAGGLLTVSDDINVSATVGHLGLSTSAGAIDLSADVTLAHGSLDVSAATGLVIDGLVTLSGGVASAPTIALLAQTGALVMSSTAALNTSAGGGNVRLKANEQIKLAQVNAGTGAVELESTTRWCRDLPRLIEQEAMPVPWERLVALLRENGIDDPPAG